MGEGCIDYAQLPWDTVEGREGQGYDAVEGADSSRNGNSETEAADEGEEEGVYESEVIEERGRPHGAGRHEPVGHPYQGRVREEKPFALHAEAAGEALDEAVEYGDYLFEYDVFFSVAPYGVGCACGCDGEDCDDYVYVHIQPPGQRGPYLLDEEGTETVEAADDHDSEEKEHDQELPSALEDYGSEDLVV